MNKLSNHGFVESERPLPTDFDKFLPWACTQLSVEASVVITRTVLSDYVSVVSHKMKGKHKVHKPASSTHLDSDNLSDEKSQSFTTGIKSDSIINLEAIYDSSNNLVHIKFSNNRSIPWSVLKIIGLIIKFHPTLKMLSINSGLQTQAMYEISKILPLSKITEICLDQTYLVEANYHVLLDYTVLKHLSLSKCKITDVVVKTICNKLFYPSPASKALCALNLATNRITDLGVKYLAEMLRTNRQLCYLNLADNMITDTGARYIFDSLGEFPLNSTELMAKRARHMSYLKEKNELIARTVKELRDGEIDKRPARKKPVKPLTSLPTKKKDEKGRDERFDDSSKPSSMDAIYYERAEVLVESIIGQFLDPFSPDDTFMRDGSVYCFGNNTLGYLNMAYNNLTHFSVKKLYEIILTQKFLARKPKGLINIVIDGNFIPDFCDEYQQIDDMLDAGFPTYARRMSMFSNKKRRM